MAVPGKHFLSRAVLGGLLIDPDCMSRVAPVLVVDDFPTERGREVYAAMLALYQRGLPVDFVTLCRELETRGTADSVGIGNLIDLTNHCPSSLHVPAYADMLSNPRRGFNGAVRI